MKNNTSFPFVCVHKVNEQQIFGFMLSENENTVTVKAMSNNNDHDGRNVLVPWGRVDFIEVMEMEEAPWNQSGSTSHT